MSIMIVI